jgi:putative nucleotidyltransferase with HDIG domain
MHRIHEEVEKIISPVYLVGGSVRDELLGKEPKDWDFCTPVVPDEIEKAIHSSLNENGDNRKCYLTGKKFGTIGTKVCGQIVEVTTFRSEVYEKDNRKPNVEFVSDITADLSRRDFTINAIAKRGERYIDPFGGKLDLMMKTIKCVMDPKARFKEDPLRMLRAARFASQLGFDIDQNLTGHAERMSYKILHVSKERWMLEIDKLLTSEHPRRGLEFLAKTRLLNYILPELSLQVGYEQNSPHHDFTLWEHTIRVVENAPMDINLKWAALLHDIAKPFTRTEKKDRSNYITHDYLGGEFVDRMAVYLKWSNDRRIAVKEIVLTHLNDGNPLKEADNKVKKR